MNIQYSYRSWLSFARHALFIFLLNCIIIINGLQAQTYTFAQINGSPANTTGWNLQGQAGVGNILFTDNSEIILCPAVGGSNGAVFFNQPINFSICNKWVAEFDFRMFDGSGADGIAFCFLDVPPAGFVSGGGIGIPGSANGLKVCFDQFPNCTGDISEMPKIEIRWGIGYDECWSQPTLSNSGGSLDFIRSAVYNRARIVYDAGAIEVFVNDSLYLTGFQTFNFTGYMGFTSSTGAFTDNHSIRNVVIYTETATIQPNTIFYSDSCLGNATQFSIQDTSGISSISWNFGDPASGAGNTATGFNVNHTFSQIGNYNVQAILSNVCGIDTLFLNSLSIINCNRSTITGFNTIGDTCDVNANFTFQPIGTTNANSLTWTFDDPNSGINSYISFPPNSNGFHTFSAPGVYNVCVTFQEPGFPASTICRAISIGLCCNGIISSNDTCLENSIPFSILSGATLSTITWNFGDPASGTNNTSTSLTPIHLFSATGTYNIRAIVNLSCGVDTIFKTLSVIKCDSIVEPCRFFVPNTFTPNADGLNDKFYPLTSCTFERYEFLIYNRWGELIFKTANQTDKWDGKYKGADSPVGVYCYLIQYQSSSRQTKKVNGSVTLLR